MVGSGPVEAGRVVFGGSLSLPSIAATRPYCQLEQDAQAGVRMILVPRCHPRRSEVEDCIRIVYDAMFGARHLTLPANLIALSGRDGRTLCAAGIRLAEDGFFSEVYLDRTVERILSQRTAEPVSRASIFEVTNLASRSAAHSGRFILTLALCAKDAGFNWCFFTATVRLRGLLRRLGLPLIELAAATPERVTDAEYWGRYYEHSPKVCAVHGAWLDPRLRLADDA